MTDDEWLELQRKKTRLSNQIELLKSTRSPAGPYGKGSLGEAERKVEEKITELSIELVLLEEQV